MTPGEWYLELAGRKAGPYTVEQVQGLFQEGQVHGHIRATSDRLKGEWITVDELLTAWRDALKASDTTHYQLPARPAEVDTHPSVSHPIEGAAGRVDPAQNLFDALLVARERKAASKLTPALHKEWGSLSRPQRIMPSQVWLIITLALVLGISIIGLLRLLQNKEPATETTPVAKMQPGNQTNETPPAAAEKAAPPRPAEPLRSQPIHAETSRKAVRIQESTPDERDAPQQREEAQEPPPSEPTHFDQASPPPDGRTAEVPEVPPLQPHESDPYQPVPPDSTPEGVPPDATTQ